MSLTVAQWHDRFTQQASWTKQLRAFLYDQVGLRSNSRVLEVGCGTGAITSDFVGREQINYIGLDIDLTRLTFARSEESESNFVGGNAYSLPFADGSFDFVISHFLFLWLDQPLVALNEMMRVTRTSGAILALAEPDYGSRIDEPSSLDALGKAQLHALQLQGANPLVGRSLPGIFKQADLTQIRFGCSGFQTRVGSLPDGFDLEWQVLEQDLRGTFSTEELNDYRQLDHKAWLDGSRVLWVPTFYAIGIKNQKSYVQHH